MEFINEQLFRRNEVTESEKSLQIETERKNTTTSKEINTTYDPITNSYDSKQKNKIM